MQPPDVAVNQALVLCYQILGEGGGGRDSSTKQLRMRCLAFLISEAAPALLYVQETGTLLPPFFSRHSRWLATLCTKKNISALFTAAQFQKYLFFVCPRTILKWNLKFLFYLTPGTRWFHYHSCYLPPTRDLPIWGASRSSGASITLTLYVCVSTRTRERQFAPASIMWPYCSLNGRKTMKLMCI